MKDRSDVCVVSQPMGNTGDSATRTLLNILSEVTDAVLMAAAVPENASIREKHEIIDISGGAVGNTILSDAIGFLILQLRMCLAISRRNESIVLFFGTTSYLLPILWSRLIGRTVVLEPRGDVPLCLRLRWEQHYPSVVAKVLASGLSLMEHTGYRVSHAIISYTPLMASDLGLDRYERKLYPKGARYVDIEQFSVDRAFGERNLIVGYIGRFDEEKGVREFAKAVPGLPSEVTVRFIGGGPLTKWLEEELATEIEQGQVEIISWVDHEEVPDQLNQLQLLVLPSASEGLPTVILESLACGTPVYATPVSGVPDVVRDGATGFLMQSVEPATIATDIQEILSEAPLSEISENGRELAKSEYSFEAAVQRYQTILTAIVDSRTDN